MGLGLGMMGGLSASKIAISAGWRSSKSHVRISDHTKAGSAGSTGSTASVGSTGSVATTGSSSSASSKSGIDGEGEGGWGLEGVGGTEEGVWEKRMWVL